MNAPACREFLWPYLGPTEDPRHLLTREVSRPKSHLCVCFLGPFPVFGLSLQKQILRQGVKWKCFIWEMTAGNLS